jgi:hypothetical protein
MSKEGVAHIPEMTGLGIRRCGTHPAGMDSVVRAVACGASQTRPSRTATAAASVRLATPNLAMTLET